MHESKSHKVKSKREEVGSHQNKFFLSFVKKQAGKPVADVSVLYVLLAVLKAPS